MLDIYQHLVVDLENQGILCRAPTSSVANAVSLGFINTTTTVLLEFPWTKEKSSGVNFDGENWQLMRRGHFVKMPADLVTEEWLAKKALAMKRRNFQWAWEGRCIQQLRRAADFHSPGVFESYVMLQLQECDPISEVWPIGILEWASIHQVTPEMAYQDLKLRMDSLGLMYLRNAALHKKIMEDINKGTSEEEMHEALRIGLDAMFLSKSLL